MMDIHFDRTIKGLLSNVNRPNKVILLLGPRRVGKTILLKHLTETLTPSPLFLNAEDVTVQESLQKRSIAHYENLLGDTRLLIIDEAQKIPNIGDVLKLLIDSIPGLQIIVTGSSAFDLTNLSGEPLTGRSITHHLFPMAQCELKQYENALQTTDNLHQRLVFGSYPEVFQYKSNSEKSEYLRELVNSYLLKDILMFDGIRQSAKLFNLLRLVAFQVGSEISYDELARNLAISKNTVERYLDLLSKVFVIFKLGGFSRNMRKEVVKSSKWYFHDNGVRNTLISNHNLIELRNDAGALWENYLIAERLKYQSYNKMLVQNYFWRTYDRQEIDWVEERDGNLYAYEMKWNPKKVKTKPPVAWQKAYPEAEFRVLTPDNYLDWIGG